jgi:DNA-directed RNA polymerase sigma subunit (sigma70/sigma32)
MRLKYADLNEKQLKDYLIASAYMKEMPADMMDLALNKYKTTGSQHDRDEVQRLLIENHLKMVITIANRYRGAGLSFARLIKEGNAGLISAVKKWDRDDNENFTQYIVWGVEGAIIEALIRCKKEVKGL